MSPFSTIMPAPFGALGIRCTASEIEELVYLPASYCQPQTTAPNALCEEAIRQIKAYFADPDYRFDLPLAPRGTAFQQRVWQQISAVPRGEVVSYGLIAKALQSAPRAVGQACGANWFPLIIPCHRVTASKGIGGFANHDDANGFHLQVKRWLLAHEKVAGYDGAALWQD